MVPENLKLTISIPEAAFDSLPPAEGAAADGAAGDDAGSPVVGLEVPHEARRIVTAAPAARANGFITITTAAHAIGFNAPGRIQKDLRKSPTGHVPNRTAIKSQNFVNAIVLHRHHTLSDSWFGKSRRAGSVASGYSEPTRPVKN
jgi:hypothetical protein